MEMRLNYNYKSDMVIIQTEMTGGVSKRNTKRAVWTFDNNNNNNIQVNAWCEETLWIIHWCALFWIYAFLRCTKIHAISN